MKETINLIYETLKSEQYELQKFKITVNILQFKLFTFKKSINKLKAGFKNISGDLKFF